MLAENMQSIRDKDFYRKLRGFIHVFARKKHTVNYDRMEFAPGRYREKFYFLITFVTD